CQVGQETRRQEVTTKSSDPATGTSVSGERDVGLSRTAINASDTYHLALHPSRAGDGVQPGIVHPSWHSRTAEPVLTPDPQSRGRGDAPLPPNRSERQRILTCGCLPILSTQDTIRSRPYTAQVYKMPHVLRPRADQRFSRKFTKRKAGEGLQNGDAKSAVII